MKQKQDIFEEVAELISEGQDEISEEKKILFDKTTGQASIKIPKSLALKAGMNEDSEVKIILNPKEETEEKLKKARFVIYLKEGKDGDDKGA